MKKNLLIITFLFVNSILCFGQGMSKFEIWGWNGTKQEFAKIYKSKSGVDVNNGYCCMATLGELGYKHSVSLIAPDNIEEYMTGKANWDQIPRLVVIRQVSENTYTKLAADKEWQTKLEETISGIYYPQTTAVNLWQSNDNFSIMDLESGVGHSLNPIIAKDKTLLDNLLLGTIALNTTSDLRNKCCNVLNNEVDLTQWKPSTEELEILSTMLSFPDPATCATAIKIVAECRHNIENKAILFKDGALTVKDFLKSELFTFKPDALKFLKSIEPKGTQWASDNWIKWMNNNIYQN